jgi:hypothetical protein
MTRLTRFARTGFVSAAILLLTTEITTAAGPDRTDWETATLTIDLTSYFDANSLLMFVGNTGSFAYDKTALLGKNDGLYFPRTTNKTAVYAAGIWVGAKVSGETRVTVAEYSNEYVPGPMLNGTFQPDNPVFHVYKIKQGDTRLSNPDYANWPYDQGAPVVKNHLGNDSIGADGYRIPLCWGKQALWSVFNDARSAEHSNHAGSTPPLGVEVQLYAYGSDLSCELGQTVFLRYTLINKGANSLESTYVGLWGDPDLGSAYDDLTGCDSTLSLAYCYNAGPDPIYGAAPPTVGFGLLQGPMVPSPGDSAWRSGEGRWLPDFRNLPMTAFNKYINGTDPSSAIESYNYLGGLDRTGATVIDPTTGLPTKFVCSGDPWTGTGWLDNAPADRRFMLSSGPFAMAPGDTQEVVAAVMVGAGTGGEFFDFDTIPAAHIAGASVGTAFGLVVDPSTTTGHNYRINFQVKPDSTEFAWSVTDLFTDLMVVSGQTNQSGDEDYPIFDGMKVKVICPVAGVGGWDVPSGTRRFTWIGAGGLQFEGFDGAIGWNSPFHLLGGGPPGVPPLKVKNVLLKLATVDANGNFDQNDPEVSYGYRYGRSFADPPVKPEFAPFIINPVGGYSFQDYSKSVPLSAWDTDADPPRRLAIGYLENNQLYGTVDGKYWPPNGYATDNTVASGPREWLWIFDTDYSATPDPGFEVEATMNPLPIMYFLTVARDGNVEFATGDQFLIVHRTDYNTDLDLFEFTSPLPSAPPQPDVVVCDPIVAYSSVVELKRVDSLIRAEFQLVCNCPRQGDIAQRPTGNGSIDVFDVIEVIAVAFSGSVDPQDPQCPRTRGDVNNDGVTDVFDVIYLIATAFSGGPAPVDPCGP